MNFGCSEGAFGRRFSHALTAYLNDERIMKERSRTDVLDADALAVRYEQWRAVRVRDRHAGMPDDRPLDGEPPASRGHASGSPPGSPPATGRIWTIPSTAETVELGRFDPARPPIVTIESGDVLVYTNTWTHFLNRLQPGVSIEELGRLRRAGQGRGVHSIVGPIAVVDAEPGDLLELRFLTLRPIDFGANFHNERALQTGALPDDFEHGHVHYFDLNGADGYVEFAPHIKLEMKPFQGTIGVAHPSGAAVSSVAPGQHAGNIDVKELTAGSALFVPVWLAGGLIYTGDSHALQGDGEVNITALETAMEEVRVQVVLHKRQHYAWPMIETPTHWLMLGMDVLAERGDARSPLRNTIDFLAAAAHLSRDDAYGLASLAVDFRVSQMGRCE